MYDPSQYVRPQADRQRLEEHFGVPIADTVDKIYSLGASNVSMVLNRNPYGGPHRVRADLLGRGEAVTGDQLARGHELENTIAMLVIEDLLARGFSVIEPWGSTRWYALPWTHCTYDRLILNKDGVAVGVLEIKSVNNEFKTYSFEDRDDHQLQMEHCAYAITRAWGKQAHPMMPESMLVCLATSENAFTMLREKLAREGLDSSVALAQEMVKTGLAKLHICKPSVDPDKYERDVIPVLSEWYKQHVVLDQMPAVDDSRECSEFLRLSVDERDGDTEVCNNIAQLAKRRIEIKETIKELESEVRGIDNQLKLVMGRHRRAFGQGVSVTISRRPGARRLNQAKMREEVPDIVERFIEEGNEYEVLLVKRQKQEVRDGGEEKEAV